MSGERKALIVASDEYEHEGLSRLRAPAADAEALARVLADPQIGNFDVQVAHNKPAHLIQRDIEDFLSEGRHDDVLLLHFSCHGLKNESGDLFFAARDTLPRRLSSTAVAAGFVQQCIRASRAQWVVLLLDCCYGGAFGEGATVRAGGDANVLDAFPDSMLGRGKGRAVITAANAVEYAMDGDRLADDKSPQPSVFTGALVEGLTNGDADRNEDGWVSLNELYEYLFEKVRERNPHQTPSRNGEMQGELHIARSRRQRIRASPLPPDLEAATKDANMFTRLGAVRALRDRLASENISAAVGAWEALAVLATDHEYVAKEALAARGDVPVRPSETDVHFGPLEAGAPSPRRAIRLLGLPIARACRAYVSHNWMRVTETSEGFEISVDTSGAGTLSGSVSIKGPTGEAQVTVDADVGASRPAPEVRQATVQEKPVARGPIKAIQPRARRESSPRPQDAVVARLRASAKSSGLLRLSDESLEPVAAQLRANETIVAVTRAWLAAPVHLLTGYGQRLDPSFVPGVLVLTASRLLFASERAFTGSSWTLTIQYAAISDAHRQNQATYRTSGLRVSGTVPKEVVALTLEGGERVGLAVFDSYSVLKDIKEQGKRLG